MYIYFYVTQHYEIIMLCDGTKKYMKVNSLKHGRSYGWRENISYRAVIFCNMIMSLSKPTVYLQKRTLISRVANERREQSLYERQKGDISPAPSASGRTRG